MDTVPPLPEQRSADPLLPAPRLPDPPLPTPRLPEPLLPTPQLPEPLPPPAAEPAFWPTTGWLIAARWRIAVNGLTRGARWRRLTYLLVAGALMFLAIAGLVTSYVLTFVISGITGDPVRADVVVSTTLAGTLTLSFLVSFTVALAALYLSKDLDLLLSAPIPRRAVFTSKLVGGLIPAHFILFALALIPLIGHGLAMRQVGIERGVALPYDAAYYLALVVAMLLLPLLPVAVGSLAVMVIVRRVSAHRLGEIVGLVVVAMTLTIALLAGTINQMQQALTVNDVLASLERFRNPYSPAEWLTLAVTASARHDWAVAGQWFGLVALVSVVALVPIILTSERLYYEGWLHMQSTRTAVRRRALLPWNRYDRAPSLGRPDSWLRGLSQPLVAVLRKDLRIIPRDLTNLAQVLSPLAIGVFFILQQLLYPITLSGSDRPQPELIPILTMLSCGIAAGVSAMITTRFGLTAFSFEGRAYWVLKSAPLRRVELVVAKFLTAYVPFLGLSVILVVLLELARAIHTVMVANSGQWQAFGSAISVPYILYALFSLAVTGAGILAITLAIGAARPNLSWDTPHEMLTPDIGCLSLVFYGAYGAVAELAFILPAAIARFPMNRHPVAFWMFGLAVGLGLTAVVVAASLNLTMRELDAIGE